MEFLIVTGMSGAGKSQTTAALEDSGYYCIDNMPAALMPRIAQLFSQIQSPAQKIAVVVDTRSGEPFSQFDSTLERIRNAGVAFKVLYLDASDAVLLRRFRETRRKHPLLDAVQGRIERAISEEREMLEPIRRKADHYLDTSHFSPQQLRDRIRQMFGGDDSGRMLIHIMSFGFKYGAPRDADLIFDARCLPNPYYVPELKYKTGLDEDVREYVLRKEESRGFLTRLEDLLLHAVPMYEKEGKAQLVIGVGCTGGKHRSVTIACALHDFLTQHGYEPHLDHIDIQKA